MKKSPRMECLCILSQDGQGEGVIQEENKAMNVQPSFPRFLQPSPTAMVPHIVSNRVISGCKLPHPAVVARFPKLKAFLRRVPPSPVSCDWTPRAMMVIKDIEGNDKYGDCVEAEDAHYTAVITGNAGILFRYTREQTLADYHTITGFDPNIPNSDQGTNPLDDLNYRVTTGYANERKDDGWASVDAKNPDEVRFAINSFGNIKLWFGIPDSIVNSIPRSSGFVWDVEAGEANQENGHCIGGYGYNDQGVIISTWGMLGLVTWAALAKWFVPSVGGGIATRFTESWLTGDGETPSGLDKEGMITEFDTIFHGDIPALMSI